VGAPAKPHKLGAELVTYRVLEDPASLAPARGGHVMACAAFYE
jgi:hypothetical protein